ncbi:hypothetical protein GX48_03629 [Paracoccidioides brasiliensis]|nr:hypothetical protein GX48_03629 [Paracoccidioides brasiliensis]
MAGPEILAPFQFPFQFPFPFPAPDASSKILQPVNWSAKGRRAVVNKATPEQRPDNEETIY